MSFCEHFPDNHDAARRALYDGTVFLMPGNAVTRELVREVSEEVCAGLGDGPREAQFRFSDDDFYTRIGQLRKRFYTAPAYHDRVRQVLSAYGFDPQANAFDPIRLRVVTHGGYAQPKAAPVYYPHRDTWYANPQAQLTWWMPLHDVTPAETFEFFPDYFRVPVTNNSEIFDYDAWVRRDWDNKIGWQNAAGDTVDAYPRLGMVLHPRKRLGVACRAGDLLVFAGAHLHGTLGQDTGRTRFSIDFRTVHLGDHAAGIGAPNVDNRSTGSTLGDHVHPGHGSWGVPPCAGT